MNSYHGLLTFTVSLAILIVPQMMGHQFYMSQFLWIPRLWTIILYSHVITLSTINIYTIELDSKTKGKESDVEALRSVATNGHANGHLTRAPAVDSCITHPNEVETVL